MMKRNNFPFAAFYGLDNAKKAILIALVNPLAGGILVSGETGTGKSVLLRGARELVDAPWVEVPVGVTEDRLFGGMDTEAAIQDGKKKLQAGLLEESNHGILYIDDVNLLRDELLSSILNVTESGIYKLERDGFSLEKNFSGTVFATMNPDSGTLSAARLDKFGLFIQIEDNFDTEERKEIIKRVLEFENNGIVFRKKWEEKTEKLKNKIKDAKDILKDVTVSPAMVQLAAVYTLKAHVAGHRADIYLIEAARALAALDNRNYVLPKDLEKAAEFVLPHRMREMNAPESPEQTPPEEEKQQERENDQDSKENNQEQTNESMESSQGDTDSLGEDNHESDKNNDSLSNQLPPADENGESKERTDSADIRVQLPPIWIEPADKRKVKKGSGKRTLTRTSLMQGRYVRAESPKEKAKDIAFDATIRAAAPHQKSRKSNGCAVVISRDDIREKVREKRVGNIFLFVVDASGSMGARERMRTVKGVIFKILMEAYQKRDKVGMIAFRKNKAEVLLPVTRSVDFAKKKLENLPTGGKTPLAQGLIKASDILDMLYRQDSTQEPVVILVTDGRATKGITNGSDPVNDAVSEAKKIGNRKLPVAVIDTESGFIKLGLAKKIAKEMGASYFHLDKMTENDLLHIWRSTAYNRNKG